MEKLVMEIIASILAIISVYLYGTKSMKAPVFGMFAQIYWVYFCYILKLYGLLILCGVMLCIHVRNYIKWKREKDFYSKNQL